MESIDIRKPLVLMAKILNVLGIVVAIVLASVFFMVGMLASDSPKASYNDVLIAMIIPSLIPIVYIIIQILLWIYFKKFGLIPVIASISINILLAGLLLA